MSRESQEVCRIWPSGEEHQLAHHTPHQTATQIQANVHPPTRCRYRQAPQIQKFSYRGGGSGACRAIAVFTVTGKRVFSNFLSPQFFLVVVRAGN